MSGQYVSLTDVSCPKAGDCVAVGFDKAISKGGAVTQGLVETLSDGTWAATAVPALSSAKGEVVPSAVSCPALGKCTAVGVISSTANVITPAIETLSAGRWESAKPPLPADADAAGSATLTDISCPSVGTCYATGWYSNEAGGRDAYIDTLANGTWMATSAALPADAAPEQSSSAANTFLAAVACTGDDTCVAPGQYRDAHGQTQPFLETLSANAWRPTVAPLPADAATTGQVAGLWAIDCPAPTNCVVGGHYIKRGGQPRYLMETWSGGAWTAAALPLPADAAADQKWSQNQTTTIGGLGCESVGHCVATAGYVTKANVILPLIETLSGSTWSAARAPLPFDAVPGSEQGNGTYLELATCAAPGDCVTVGSYPAADGTVEGLIESTVPVRA